MIINLINNLPEFILYFTQKHISLIEEDEINKTITINQSYLEYSSSSEQLDIIVQKSPLEVVNITNV